jgi:hypothetical protein
VFAQTRTVNLLLLASLLATLAVPAPARAGGLAQAGRSPASAPPRAR